MRLNRGAPAVRSLLVLLGGSVAWVGCSGGEPSLFGGSGGAQALAGSGGSGGVGLSGGGSSPAGATNQAGAAQTSGGVQASSGGISASSGGSSPTGGSAPAGGSAPTGGSAPAGGSASLGGTSSNPTLQGGTTSSAGAASGGRSTTGGLSNVAGNTTSGASSTGGSSGGSGPGSAAGGSSAGGSTGGAAGGSVGSTTKFSFFVTSLSAMRRLSGNPNGFGGDLRYGEATGLAGADKICREIAESALPGAGQKTWRAFLSTVAGGPDGGPVHAIDRIGEGPWYDRKGRLVAATKADLLHDRPAGIDSAIKNDLPNETGTLNHEDETDFPGATGCTSDCPATQHDVKCASDCPDNHDILTGTGPDGKLHSTSPSSTCNDWTNSKDEAPMQSGGSTRGGGGPWCGHSWPRNGSGLNWMSALAEGGCAPGINLKEEGGPQRGVYTVGTGGGYGGIYCFALTP